MERGEPSGMESRHCLPPTEHPLLLTFGPKRPEQMINYVNRNDIFGDFRRNLSNSEIARIRNVSRTTVVGLRKLYDATVADKEHPEALSELLQTVPRYKDRVVDCPVLTDEIKALIDQELRNNAMKVATGMKKQQKKATDIHADLRRSGYTISYRTVVRYIRKRLSDKQASVSDCFIKQKYIPGERMEFDWGEVKIYIKGKLTSFNMAATALCSNGYWGRLFTRQDKQAMQEAHVNAFSFWGHVPRLMVYDNMRTAVRSFTGGEKKPTAELSQLEGYYGFKHQFCNVRSGNEKPHVERAVEILRRKAFAGRDHFDNMDEANGHLLSVCVQSNDLVKEAIKEELDNMLAAYGEMACFEADFRQVDKLSIIHLDTVSYSVPYEYIHRTVWVKKYSDDVVIYDTDGPSKKEIASHKRSHVANDNRIDIQHYLGVLKAKPGALRNSYALRQTPKGLQAVFDTYFPDDPKEFVELLIWARENDHDYQELCSAVNVAKMKGIHTITQESIKSVLVDSGSSEGLLDLPWNKSIEDGAAQNLLMLGEMFKSNANKAVS